MTHGPSSSSGVTKYYDNVKVVGGKQYTLMHDNTWWVLGVNGNRWSDPGRCWEPRVTGHWDNSAGHVLSQNCNQGHDAHSWDLMLENDGGLLTNNKTRDSIGVDLLSEDS